MPVTPPGKVQFNIYLPVDLVTRIKHAAIDGHQSLSSYAQSVFEANLQREQKEHQ